MVSAEVNCTPPAIPAPCSKPPNIPRTYLLLRLIAVSFSRRGTFRHVDSRQLFILSSCCDGLSNATALWAKHAGADRNRTQREQEANIRACFLTGFLPEIAVCPNWFRFALSRMFHIAPPPSLADRHGSIRSPLCVSVVLRVPPFL